MISGTITVLAEVDPAALHKRHSQGWVQEVVYDLDSCIARIKRVTLYLLSCVMSFLSLVLIFPCAKKKKARQEKKPASLAFLGNVVSLWQRLAEEPELLVELGSDQTSLHNPYNGGYYPVQLTFEESKKMMAENPARFKELVQESLRIQVEAINKLAVSKSGCTFFDCN